MTCSTCNAPTLLGDRVCDCGASLPVPWRVRYYAPSGEVWLIAGWGTYEEAQAIRDEYSTPQTVGRYVLEPVMPDGWRDRVLEGERTL